MMYAAAEAAQGKRRPLALLLLLVCRRCCIAFTAAAAAGSTRCYPLHAECEYSIQRIVLVSLFSIDIIQLV
jgi:hypothetical protein